MATALLSDAIKVLLTLLLLSLIAYKLYTFHTQPRPEGKGDFQRRIYWFSLGIKIRNFFLKGLRRRSPNRPHPVYRAPRPRRISLAAACRHPSRQYGICKNVEIDAIEREGFEFVLR
eukprot:1364376-Amorphochlora_amoeboformis.AAC.1